MSEDIKIYEGKPKRMLSREKDVDLTKDYR